MIEGGVSGEFLYNHDKIRISRENVKDREISFTAREIHNIKENLSNFYSLCYIENGGAIAIIDGYEFKVPENSLVIADKYEVVAFKKYGTCMATRIAVDFKPELFGRCDKKEKDFNETLKHVVGSFENVKVDIPKGYYLKDKSGRIKYLFENSEEEYKARKLNYADIIKGNIYAILTEVARDLGCFENANIKVDLVQRIVDYTELHYRENLTIEALAYMFNYSGSYITKIFKKELGMTYSEYLRQRRIYEASCLISKENFKVKEIAKLVGFNDTAHFVKCFEKYVGMSPSAYRLNMREAKQWFIGLKDLKAQKDISQF